MKRLLTCVLGLPPLARRLIETTSAVGIPLSSAHQSCLYAQLLDNLRHSSPDIQRAAAAALGTYAGQYLQKATPEALEQSTAQFLGDLRDALGSPPAKRGAALALGALPRYWLEAARTVSLMPTGVVGELSFGGRVAAALL